MEKYFNKANISGLMFLDFFEWINIYPHKTKHF